MAIVSAPSYDPNKLRGKSFGKNFQELARDSLKPLFNRPIMAMYPPGSIFKTVQSLIALQEGVVRADEQVAAFNSPMRDHAPFGYYDVPKAIQYSSNTYFYHLFRRIIERKIHTSKYLDARPRSSNMGRLFEKIWIWQ